MSVHYLTTSDLEDLKLSIGRSDNSKARGIAQSLLENPLLEDSDHVNVQVVDDDDALLKEKTKQVGQTAPNMWAWDRIGLFCNYAALGLVYGTGLTSGPLCYYVFTDASPNLCANASSISLFAWSIKIFYAIFTDSYRPFGMRRVPYMIVGWGTVLTLLLVLAICADQLNPSLWIAMLMLIQAGVMLADVPADGYMVEIGQLEPHERRGNTLATGQIVRFLFTMISGGIQAFLLNGPATSKSSCTIDFNDCWSWGLTINQYYLLNFLLVLCICFPMIWLKELDCSHLPRHSLSHYFSEIWECLKNLTTFNCIVYVVMFHGFTNFNSVVNTYMQYRIIQLSNFQSGIDTITTFLTLAFAIYLFKTYLLNVNWRYTNIATVSLSSLLGLLWILVYYNIGGLRNGWFTIFVDLDQSFVHGISQVLFSMSVIELAKPGLESTTYELLISVGNAGGTVNRIVATQFLTPMKSVACEEVSSYSNIDDDSVKNFCELSYPPTYLGPTQYADNCVSTKSACFDATDGPHRYTSYCLLIIGVSIATCLIFVNFLPKSKEQCHEWRRQGELSGNSELRGYVTLFICVLTVGYGISTAILLLQSSTSCLQFIGGHGC